MTTGIHVGCTGPDEALGGRKFGLGEMSQRKWMEGPEEVSQKRMLITGLTAQLELVQRAWGLRTQTQTVCEETDEGGLRRGLALHTCRMLSARSWSL